LRAECHIEVESRQARSNRGFGTWRFYIRPAVSRHSYFRSQIGWHPATVLLLKAKERDLAATLLALNRIAVRGLNSWDDELELHMVAGEPDSIRVKFINGQWLVRVVEGGRLAHQLFDIHAEAEAFAEEERHRLGLPGEPPAEEPVETRRRGGRGR